MSRYPYTYAADYLREIALEQKEEVNFLSPKLSRSDASQIRNAIAETIGIDDHELACKLADAFMRKNNIEKGE